MSTRASTGVLLRAGVDFGARLGGLVTLPILARYAGIDGYGAYGQVQTIVGFLLPFAMLGMGGAMVRFFAGGEWSVRLRSDFLRALLLVTIASAVVTAGVALEAERLNRWFLGWPGGTELFRAGAFLILAGSLEQLLFDFFRARQWYGFQSSLQLVEIVLSVGAVVVLIPSGWGLSRLLLCLVAIRLAVAALGFAALWRVATPVVAEAGGPSVPRSALIRFGLPLSVAGLGLWMMNLGDRLVIGHFLTPSALGLYGAVYTVACLLVAANAPLNYPLYPRLMRVVGSGRGEEIAREVTTFHRYAVLVLVPAAVLVALAMQPALVLVAGSEFRVDVALAVLMVAPIFLDQWNSIAHYVVLCRDDGATFSQNLWLATGVANVLLNLVAVPAFGLHGAAFVTLASFVALELAMFRKAREIVPLDRLYRFDVSWKAASAAALAAIPIWLLEPETPWELLAACFAFGVVYLSCCALGFREIRRADFEVLIHAFDLRR